MKNYCKLRIYFLGILIVFASLQPVNTLAQVSNYFFNASTGTYTALSNSTQIIGGSEDDTWSSSTNIGFNFSYGGTAYTQFRANSNGFIRLATGTFTGSYDNDLSSSTTPTYLIAPFWDDLETNSTGNVSYELNGTTGNRILTVEFKDMTHYLQSYHMYFQIKLYENGDLIKFNYGNMDTWTGESASIGINDSTGGTNFISVTPGNPHTASSTTANNNISTNTYLTNGLIYTLFFTTYQTNFGVISWESPNSNCGLTSSEPVTIKIKNFGTVAQNSFSLSYSINNGSSYTTQSVSQTIQPDSVLTFTFTQTANFSNPGIYPIIIAVILPNDSFTDNDTLLYSINSFGTISSFPFTENFNNGYTSYFQLQDNTESDIYIENNTGVQSTPCLHFEGGTATGWPTFDPTSADSAWSYTSHHAQAVTCIVNATGLSNLKLSFDIKQIAGYTNSTYNWLRVLINDTIQIATVNGDTNLNNTTPNSDPFSNKVFDLSSFAGTQFTLTLQSSSKYITEIAYIDNIKLFEPVNNDVGVSLILGPASSSLCGQSPDSVIVIVNNYGINSQSNIPVVAVIITPTSTVTLNSTLSGPLSANQSDTIFLGTINTTISGPYSITAYTNLSSDTINKYNDTAYSTVLTDTALALPYLENFDGSNPLANWIVDYMGTTNGHGNTSTVLAANLWTSSQYAVGIMTKKLKKITATSYLSFDYRIVNYVTPNDSTIISAGDVIHIFISTNCFATFDTLYTINNLNHIPSKSMVNRNLSLSNFSGNEIMLAYVLYWASGDYYVDLDNILFYNVFGLGPDTAICTGDSVELSTGIDTSYSHIWKQYPSGSIISTAHKLMVNTAGTYYVEVYDGSIFYDSDTITITLNPLPNINAGNDQTVCFNDNVVLTATGGSTYLWSTSQSGAIINLIATNTTDYIVTGTDSLGCSMDDTVKVIVNPLPSVNLGNDTTFCSGNSLILNAGTSPGLSFDWKIVPSSVTISTDSSITVDSVGIYYVSVTNVHNCLTIDTIEINIFSLPTAYAGLDTSLCLGDTVTLYATGGSSYLWNTNDTTYNITVSPIVSQNYVVQVFNLNACFAFDSVMVVVNPLPIAIAGNNTSINCGDSFQLGTLPTNGYSYIWSPSTFLSDTTISNPYTKTFYKLTYSLLVTENATGCQSSDGITISIQGGPVAFAGNDTTICDGYIVNLTATGGTSYDWSTGEKTASINVSPGSTTKYHVMVSVGGCSDIDTVEIQVNPLPIVEIDNLPERCINETTIHLNDFVNISGGIWSSSSSTGLVYPDNFIPSAAGVGQHWVYYNYIDPATNCSNADTGVISINALPMVNLGEDTFLNANQSILLDAGAGYASYLWSDSSTDQTLYLDSSINGPGYFTFWVYIVDIHGCTDYDTINILIKETIGIDESGDRSQIRIYPNPARDAVFVSWNKSFKMEIFDIVGKKLLTSEKFKTDISLLPTGIYTILIMNKYGLLLKVDKLVIE